MKRFLVPALALGVIVTALFSCDKEISEENGLLPGQNINTSNCKACAYIPWCDHSVYTYSDTVGGSATNSVEVISLAGDTTIDGTTYTTTAVTGNGTIYHNCTAGVTNELTSNPFGDFKDILLKENEPVGGTWSTVQNVSGVSTNYEYTVVEKGISRTVAGVVYTDVIHVRRITKTLMIPVLSEEIYYARAVGLIENITSDAVGGTQVSHRVLVNYSIP
jgi:hypothetical protein